jgi:tetratricopeptide (TPR) repeat protein
MRGASRWQASSATIQQLIHWVSRNKDRTLLKGRAGELIHKGHTVSAVVDTLDVPDAVVRHWVREASLEQPAARVGASGAAQSKNGGETMPPPEGPDLLLGLSALRERRLEDAKHYFRVAFNDALTDPETKAEASLQLSQAFFRNGEIEEAAQECARAQHAYEALRDEESVGRCLHVRGMLELGRDNAASAVREFARAMTIAEKYDSNPDICRLLHQTGIALQLLGKKDDAREKFKRALEIARSLEDDEQVSASSYHLAVLFVDDGNNEEGLKYYEESVALRRGYQPDTLDDTTVLFTIADLATKLGRHERALQAMIEVRALPGTKSEALENRLDLNIEYLRGQMGRDQFVQAWRSSTAQNPPGRYLSHPKEVWERSQTLTAEGDELVCAKEFSKARTCYERAIEPMRDLDALFEKRNETLRLFLLNRDLAAPLARLAWVLREMDEPQCATDAWEQVAACLARAVTYLPNQQESIEPLLKNAQAQIAALRDFTAQAEALDQVRAGMHPTAWRSAQLFADQFGHFKAGEESGILLHCCWSALFPGQDFDPKAPDYSRKDARFREFVTQEQINIINATKPLVEYRYRKIKIGIDSWMFGTRKRSKQKDERPG